MKFVSANAQKIYDAYIRRVDRLISPLAQADKNEISMEVNSHIYESMQQQSTKDEITSLLDALSSLGEPEEYLRPLIAQKKLHQATTTFRLSHVLSALRYNIPMGFAHGIRFVAVAFLYLLILIFPILMLLKVIYPGNTGYFKDSNSGSWAFGFLTPVNNYQELLGWWMLPICLLATIVCYYLITLTLRLFRKKE